MNADTVPAFQHPVTVIAPGFDTAMIPPTTLLPVSYTHLVYIGCQHCFRCPVIGIVRVHLISEPGQLLRVLDLIWGGTSIAGRLFNIFDEAVFHRFPYLLPAFCGWQACGA